MVEVGLYEVAGNPNLTFIFFIALVLLTALGARFAFYAWRNRARTDIEAQAPIWTHMLYIGGLAAVYGLLGLLEIVSSLRVEAKTGVMLATVLAIAFTIRQVHYTTSGATGVSAAEQLARAAFIGAVFAEVVLVFARGQSDVTAVLQGAAALTFVAYGVAFYRRQARDSRLQGTMLDSLLRHLLPVLTFASLVSVVALAIPAGLPRVVVLHIQVVFIIMTATALMTATIKLQQNLASL